MWRTIFRSSSFWAGALGAVGAVLVPLKIVTVETWQILAQVIGGYIVVRVSGDVAKAKIAPAVGNPVDLAYKESAASEHK